MKILSIDTSTNLASLAITSETGVLAETLVNTDRTLSIRLIPAVERLTASVDISISDIDLFAAGIGPGSFTGVRAGIATIQGFSLASDKPCACFSSLAVLAMNLPLSTTPVCAMLDARKSEVYAAVYECNTALPQPVIEDCVMKPEAFLEKLGSKISGEVIFCGEGTVRYKELIIETLQERAVFAPLTCNIGRAANGALLAMHNFQAGKSLPPSQLLPVYLRASEAEYAKLEKQAQLRSKQPN